MKMIGAMTLAAFVVMTSNANAQNQQNKHNKPVSTIPVGPEGSAGDSVGQISFGEINNFTEGMVGARFYADMLFGVKINKSSYSTVAIVLGSAMDVNDGGILVKPDFGFLFRNQYAFMDVTLGPSILHGFACCYNPNTYFGYHVSLEPGFRFGAIQLGIPLSVGQIGSDNVWVSVLSIGIDLGVQF